MHKIMWMETLKLWCFGLLKIPLVFWLKPRVLEVNNERAVLRIPLAKRTKNHVRSMYFGALCAGADIVGGLHVMHYFNNRLNKMTFVFKDFQAEFLKRAEHDVNFLCEDGKVIADLINKAKQSQVRENALIHVQAYTNHDLPEVVANFKMTLSVKARHC